MQAAGRTDRRCTGTGTGIIIKSNLVSFKCDLYAESVCPFFPKTKDHETRKPQSEQKKKNETKIERAIQSHPIPFNPAAEVLWQNEKEMKEEEEENKKRNNFWKVPKTKRYFLIEINLNCFLEMPLGSVPTRQKASTGLNASDLVYKASVSIRYICVCLQQVQHQLKINPFEASRGKYSHAYAQICWQLFRWISINPKCLKTYVRTSLWVTNIDWCSLLHDQLRRSCHTV